MQKSIGLAVLRDDGSIAKTILLLLSVNDSGTVQEQEREVQMQIDRSFPDGRAAAGEAPDLSHQNYPESIARIGRPWRARDGVGVPYVKHGFDWAWWIPRDGTTERASDFRNVQYKRKPGTTGHKRSENFAVISPRDMRGIALEQLEEFHHAGARHDVTIFEVIDLIHSYMTSVQSRLINDKAALGEPASGTPEARRLEELKGEIAELQTARQACENMFRKQEQAAAAVRLAKAMIEGHGVGFINIQAWEYSRIAKGLVERWVRSQKEMTREDSRDELENMVENLHADEGKSVTDRLVPNGGEDSLVPVDIDALYKAARKPPPQYGSAAIRGEQPAPSGGGT